LIIVIDNESSEGWINWFCDIEGHEFFVEVDEGFITDKFNLWGLKELIGPKFDMALKMILSKEIPQEEDLAKPR